MANDKKKQEAIEAEKVRKEALLEAIAILGGQGMKEEDIVYEGVKLVLPERWTGNLGAALDYLSKKQMEEESSSTFRRTYKYRPWDGAYNAFNAMKKAFGMVTGVAINSFFGSTPPTYVTIPISESDTAEVPWGKFAVPILENTDLYFSEATDDEFGPVFEFIVSSPRKNRFVIQGLFDLIERELSENSIYRGKAFDGQETPKFLNLSGFDDDKVVYADVVRADLDAHIWGVLKYSEANKKAGLSLKRAVLLHGPYGTGKSLAGWKTGLVARDNGWTFIMARPGRDDFAEVMQTARLYQPAVVFMEDVEQIASADNVDQISLMLDLFDGIEAKSNDLMVVLTTNHPDVLHKGMMRPGRLDAIIEIANLDANGIEKLIRVSIGNDKLADDVDFAPIVEACEGYLPAFIREAANRAIRYAIVRNNGILDGVKISTEDLVYSALGLRPQYNRMTGLKEVVERGTIEHNLDKLVSESVRREIGSLIANPDNVRHDVWDKKEVKKAQAGK